MQLKDGKLVHIYKKNDQSDNSRINIKVLANNNINLSNVKESKDYNFETYKKDLSLYIKNYATCRSNLDSIVSKLRSFADLSKLNSVEIKILKAIGSFCVFNNVSTYLDNNTYIPLFLITCCGMKGYSYPFFFSMPPQSRTPCDRGLCSNIGKTISENLVRVASSRIFNVPHQAIVELIVNSVDAYNPAEKIGRFGMGFFSFLYFLLEKSQGREIQITTTCDNKKGNKDRYTMIIKKDPELIFNIKYTTTKENTGTTISLLCDNKNKLDGSDVEKFRHFISYTKYIESNKATINESNKATIDESNKEVLYFINNNEITIRDAASGIPLDIIMKSLFIPSSSTKGMEIKSAEETIPDNKLFSFDEVKQNETAYFSITVRRVCIFRLPIDSDYDIALHLPGTTALPVARDDFLLNDITYKNLYRTYLALFTYLVNTKEDITYLDKINKAYANYTVNIKNKSILNDILNDIKTSLKIPIIFVRNNLREWKYILPNTKLILSNNFSYLEIEEKLSSKTPIDIYDISNNSKTPDIYTISNSSITYNIAHKNVFHNKYVIFINNIGKDDSPIKTPTTLDTPYYIFYPIVDNRTFSINDMVSKIINNIVSKENIYIYEENNIDLNEKKVINSFQYKHENGTPDLYKRYNMELLEYTATYSFMMSYKHIIDIIKYNSIKIGEEFEEEHKDLLLNTIAKLYDDTDIRLRSVSFYLCMDYRELFIRIISFYLSVLVYNIGISRKELIKHIIDILETRNMYEQKIHYGDLSGESSIIENMDISIVQDKICMFKSYFKKAGINESEYIIHDTISNRVEYKGDIYKTQYSNKTSSLISEDSSQDMINFIIFNKKLSLCNLEENLNYIRNRKIDNIRYIIPIARHFRDYISCDEESKYFIYKMCSRYVNIADTNIEDENTYHNLDYKELVYFSMPLINTFFYVRSSDYIESLQSHISGSSFINRLYQVLHKNNHTAWSDGWKKTIEKYSEKLIGFYSYFYDNELKDKKSYDFLLSLYWYAGKGNIYYNILSSVMKSIADMFWRKEIEDTILDKKTYDIVGYRDIFIDDIKLIKKYEEVYLTNIIKSTFLYNNLDFNDISSVEDESSDINLQIIPIATDAGTAKLAIDSVLIELIQNSRDAIISDIDVTNKKCDIIILEDKQGMAVKIRDYVGMNMDNILSMSIPFYSTKSKDDATTAGEMGTGFFNVYRAAETVTIETRKNNKYYRIEDIPEKRRIEILQTDQIYDIRKNIEIYTAENKDIRGTTISLLLKGDAEELFYYKKRIEYYIDNIIKYIPNETVDITYNGKSINDNSEIYFTILENNIKIYILKGKENTISQVYTKDIPFCSLLDIINNTFDEAGEDVFVHVCKNLLYFDIIVNFGVDTYQPVQSRSKLIMSDLQKNNFRNVLKRVIFYKAVILMCNNSDLYMKNILKGSIVDDLFQVYPQPKTSLLTPEDYFYNFEYRNNVSNLKILDFIKTRLIHCKNIINSHKFDVDMSTIWHYVKKITINKFVLPEEIPDKYKVDNINRLQNELSSVLKEHYEVPELKDKSRSSYGSHNTEENNDTFDNISESNNLMLKSINIIFKWMDNKYKNIIKRVEEHEFDPNTINKRYNKNKENKENIDKLTILESCKPFINKFNELYINEYVKSMDRWYNSHLYNFYDINGRKIPLINNNRIPSVESKVIEDNVHVLGYYNKAENKLVINMNLNTGGLVYDTVQCMLEYCKLNKSLYKTKKSIELYRKIQGIYTSNGESALLPHEIEHWRRKNSHLDKEDYLDKGAHEDVVIKQKESSIKHYTYDSFVAELYKNIFKDSLEFIDNIFNDNDLINIAKVIEIPDN
jgi:hypothetical protein